jgi:hypothetical protein
MIGSGPRESTSPTSSSGAIIITADAEGNRFAEMLWQKFQIGAGPDDSRKNEKAPRRGVRAGHMARQPAS